MCVCEYIYVFVLVYVFVRLAVYSGAHVQHVGTQYAANMYRDV